MSNNSMDNYDNKSEEGRRQFEKQGGDMNKIKSELDSMIDGMMSSDDVQPDEEAADADEEEAITSRRWLYVLGCILGLAIIAYLGYTTGSAAKSAPVKAPTEQLFAQYFEPMADASSQIQRGEDNTEDLKENLTKGLAAYRSKDYDTASDLLLSIDDVDAQFYGAVSVLASGDAELALSYLDAQSQNPEYQKYQDAIQWYTALCHISLGNTAEARIRLLPIFRSDHYQSQAAQELLKKI